MSRNRKGPRRWNRQGPQKNTASNRNSSEKQGFSPVLDTETALDCIDRHMCREWPRGLADFRSVLQFILTRPELNQRAPSRPEIAMFIPGAGSLVLNFLGRGRIELDPSGTSDSKAMAELTAALRLLRGEWLTVASEVEG